MNEPRSERSRIGHGAMAALAVALIGALMAACSPSTPPGPSAGQQFCEFWERVEEAPPALDHAVLVKDDVVALAADTDVIGADCAAPGAKVELDGAVLAEGEEVPSEQGDPSSVPLAAITGPEIAAQAPVFDNLEIGSLSAEIGQHGIRVSGSAAITLSGTTSSIGFVGTMTDLANWSVTLSSGAFSIPGVTTAPAQFTGTLRVSNGVPSLALNAAVSSARIGDVVVTGAGIALRISPDAGVAATVEGAIRVGPSTAEGVLDVAFDKAGALVSVEADLAAHLVGHLPGGKVADLQGMLKLTGNAQETVASFSGSGVLGDLVIHAAHGSLLLGTDEATFVGLLDVAVGSTYVRYNGSIVWDGQVVHTPYMTLEAGGEFSGTLSDGQTISAKGDLSVEVIGGQNRTVMTGDFQVGTLRATGSAIVEHDGASTALYVSADLVAAGFDATLEGVVVITDGAAELVSLDAEVDASFDLGDLSVTGANLAIRSTYGAPLELEFSGGFRVGDEADFHGDLAATVGPNGTLLSLTGDLSGSMHLDGWDIRDVAARVDAGPTQVTVTASGLVSMTNFPMEIAFGGTFSSDPNGQNWSLTGTGGLRIASIDAANVKFRLSQGASMKATRVGFYFAILGIPTYFEGDFHVKAAGGCEKVVITSGGVIAKAILAGVLPGVIGCPVHT